MKHLKNWLVASHNSRRLVRIALLIGTILSSLLLIRPGQAQAATPLIFDQQVDDTFTDTTSCSFPIVVHFEGTIRFIVDFDQAGNVTKIIETSPGIKGTFTNPVTGASVWTPSTNVTLIRFNPDNTLTVSLRGLVDRVVVPGQGLVVADAGNITFLFVFNDQGHLISTQLTFQAGQYNGLNPEPFLCSILA